MDMIIMDGDTVEFSAMAPTTLIPPILKTVIKASGKTTINGKKVCVEGDEKKVEISCPYVMSPFMGGVGTVTIKQLGSDQLTKKTKSGNKRVILKGSILQAELTVDVKGKDTNGLEDPIATYQVQGKLIPANTKIKAD
ncbi:hypothetical protein [uncultured Aquimarina sp.]|uniref:hypothetical protein n=1 Tax=uncultured Aquimarina sp. TaxID=575652 RepID=UPI00262B8305|nr:hypothetical protein [uncultured Aquimarina sp.]